MFLLNQITLQKSVDLQQNEPRPEGGLGLFLAVAYIWKVKTLTTNTGSKEVQLYLNQTTKHKKNA